jgi:hypothetical protein
MMTLQQILQQPLHYLGPQQEKIVKLKTDDDALQTQVQLIVQNIIMHDKECRILTIRDIDTEILLAKAEREIDFFNVLTSAVSH